MVKDIIELFNLSKTYKLKGHKEICALNNVNLKIKEGEIFGLLGPNGAGKTTMIKILSTLVQPTSGYATIDGHNVLKRNLVIKKKIGLMLGPYMIYYNITGYDNLKFFSKIYNIPNYKERILQISKDIDLDQWLNQYVENYSTGMKAKLALCRALLINPQVLILDEPTIGLDVQTTLFIINKLKTLNKTILLTSHDMHVIEKLCERIAFINRGKILKVGTQSELKNLMKSEIIVNVDIYDNKDQLKKELNQQNFIYNTNDTDTGLVLSLKSKNNYRDLFQILSNFNIQKIQEIDLGLDELFIKLNQ